MTQLLASQGRTSETRRYDSRDRYSYLEEGCDHYGFHHRLPRTRRKHDSIWVIVDRMTKSSRFLAVKTTYSEEDYAKLYLTEIVRLHGVPLSIISNRGPRFISQFWKSFQKGLGTQVTLSTSFHPQTDGQSVPFRP